MQYIKDNISKNDKIKISYLCVFISKEMNDYILYLLLKYKLFYKNKNLLTIKFQSLTQYFYIEDLLLNLNAIFTATISQKLNIFLHLFYNLYEKPCIDIVKMLKLINLF